MNPIEENGLPYAHGPEKSVLSSMLKSPAMIARAAAEGIGEEHFHFPAHLLLFREIRDRHAAGQEIELVGIVQDLLNRGDIDAMGGPGGITDVYTYAPNDAHFGGHVELLRQYLARRRAITAAMKIVEDGSVMDPEELTDALSGALEGAVSALSVDPGISTAREASERLAARLLAMQEEDAHVPGLATSLTPIDLATGGMRPGELWVVAAETSGGKSVVMLQAAAAAIADGKRALVISLEMDEEDIAARIIANRKTVPLGTFSRPKIATRDSLIRAKRGLEQLMESPLSIDDRGGRTLDEIVGIVQGEIDRYGKLDLVVVDYLQIVEGSGRRRSDTREQEVAAISRGLKALAKRHRIPVFTASQLNDNGKLRESRAIGQDADVVLAIEEDGIRGLKVRNGVRGQLFPLRLNGEFQRFEQFTPEGSKNP